jgi:hypothetical protein
MSVDWEKLLEAALIAAAFGIGVIAVAGLAVVASLRSQDRRAAGQGGAVALRAVTGACVLAIAAAVVLAIFVMASK